MPKFTHPDPKDKWQMRLYNARAAGGITQSQYNALARHKTELTSSSDVKEVQSMNSLKAWEAEDKKRADAAIAEAKKLSMTPQP